MCERIEKDSEKIAMLAKRCAERPLLPSLTSTTDSEHAADEHDTLLCLGSWRILFTWSETRGHQRDAPDPKSAMVWTVYEMALFGRGLGMPRPSLRCQPDALGRRKIFHTFHIAVVQMFHLTERTFPILLYHRPWKRPLR